MDESWDYDDDFDDDYGSDDDLEADTILCSNCGADIYEDAVSCPECGEYLETNTHPFTDRPQWWIMLGILGIIATTIVLFFARDR